MHSRALLVVAALVAALASVARAQEEGEAPHVALSSLIAAAASEAGAVAALESFTSSGGAIERDEAKEAVVHAMGHGWWDVSAKLIEASAAAGIDVSTTVHQTASSIQKKLQTLKDQLSKSAAATSFGIPPAFEWAQSPDTLLLNVKFAHKLDTPATLGCVLADEAEGGVGGVKLSNQSVALRADCAAQKKVFALSLALLRGIDPAGSSYSMLSVGRLAITLRKAVNGTWPRLLRSSKKLPHMHVWWAMKEKHEAANDAWEKAAAAPAPAAPAGAGDGASPAASPAPSSGATGDAPPPPPAAASASETASPTLGATAALADAIGAIGRVADAAPAADAAPSVAAAAPSVAAAAPSVASAPAAQPEEEEGEVLEAEEEGRAAAGGSSSSSKVAPSAAADAGGAPAAGGGSAPTPTKESAAARRRRLAREKAAEKASGGGGKKQRGAGSGGSGAPPAGGPGGNPFDGSPGASFTSEQLFAQLAGSIDMRQRTELKEAEETEAKTLARIRAQVAKEKDGLRRSVPDPEARQLETAKLDAQARALSAEAREEGRSKAQEIKDKFKLEYDDLRSKLSLGGAGDAKKKKQRKKEAEGEL